MSNQQNVATPELETALLYLAHAVTLLHSIVQHQQQQQAAAEVDQLVGDAMADAHNAGMEPNETMATEPEEVPEPEAEAAEEAPNEDETKDAADDGKGAKDHAPADEPADDETPKHPPLMDVKTKAMPKVPPEPANPPWPKHLNRPPPPPKVAQPPMSVPHRQAHGAACIKSCSKCSKRCIRTKAFHTTCACSYHQSLWRNEYHGKNNTKPDRKRDDDPEQERMSKERK